MSSTAVFQNCIRIRPIVFWEMESFTWASSTLKALNAKEERREASGRSRELTNPS
uniref:Uncharacterized protein n=1 Tax=Anguilla anguilla TaxID=7936 RepID=A0A0E9WLJ2_ANGAN